MSFRNINLSFKDSTQEKDFISTRQSYHLSAFRLLIFSLLFRISSTFFFFPINENTRQATHLIPLIATLMITVFIYFIITKKVKGFCSWAILICVLFFVFIFSEYAKELVNDKFTDAWTYFLLGICIESLSCLLLMSRVRWTHSIFVIALIKIYFIVRVFDVFQNFLTQKIVFIYMIIHIFLLFCLNYSNERGDRELYSNLKLKTLQLNAYEEIIKSKIPNAIIIFGEEKVPFINEVARKSFGIKEDEEIINILHKTKVVNKRQDNKFEDNSYKGTLNNLSNSLLEFVRKNEVKYLREKRNQANETSFVECDLEKNEAEIQSFSCQISPFLWNNHLRVLLILTDISSVKNHFKALDTYKDNLLATVSHDMRTPLNGMLGMLEMLLEENQMTSQTENLSVVMGSAKLLLCMVNDILDFSLISKGKLRLKFESTNITALLEETLKIFYFQLKMKGLQLEFQNWLLDKEENHIVDGNRIRQVLLNLIGNAIKFTKKGKICVRVAEELIDELDVLSSDMMSFKNKQCESVIFQEKDEIISKATKRKRLVFEVGDTGIGIKSADLSKLFKLYSRVGDNQEINKAGIGLGLAISQSLVRLMNSERTGAEITVVSEYGKGSKFSFPIYVETDPSVFFKEISAFEQRSSPFSFEAKTFNHLFQLKEFVPSSRIASEGDLLINDSKQQIRVLVVDDDPISILVAKTYLNSFEDEEFEVSTVNNGKEAIDKILDLAKNGEFFSLIIMDCNMPVMNGYETSELLKSMISSNIIPLIPIVGLTANIGNIEKEKCFASGMDCYLTKPYTKLQLIETIKETLKKKR